MRFDTVDQIVYHARSKWHRHIPVSCIPCVDLKMIRVSISATQAPNFIGYLTGLPLMYIFAPNLPIYGTIDSSVK